MGFYQALIVIHVVVAASLIGLILIQHGKGADQGANFGGGSSGTVFGARGSASFLTRLTSFLAVGFFVTSLLLGYLTLQLDEVEDDSITAPAAAEQPAVPAPAGDADIPAVPDAPTPAADSDIPAVPADAPAVDADVNKIPE
jgi:preprotein translocase subunit SecG